MRSCPLWTPAVPLYAPRAPRTLCASTQVSADSEWGPCVNDGVSGNNSCPLTEMASFPRAQSPVYMITQLCFLNTIMQRPGPRSWLTSLPPRQRS